MLKSITTAHLLTAGVLCCSLSLPIVAQAQPTAKAAKRASKMAGKQAHRDAKPRSDADKVVDALTEPEKKIFHGMSKAEKSVAHRMAHIGKQIL